MKPIFILLALVLSAHILFAQEEEKLRVAVFDPSSSSAAIDGGTKDAVRELISSAFVNTGKYIIVERSMLQQIMKEQKMSNTDAFDESQATELGRLAGANKVVLSVISLVGSRNMISIKLIDVKTATIDQQKTKLIDENGLLDAVDPLTLELLGIQTVPNQKDKSDSRGFSKTDSKPQTVVNTNDVSQSEQVPAGDGISLYFAGFSSGKNPSANIYVNDVLVGNGTLKRGFALSFPEKYAGDYKVRIEWESGISSKNYTINTNSKKQFIFEYVKGGFGYEFRLKN